MARFGGTGTQWATRLSAQIVVYAQGFVVFPVVIRVAGPETYGAYVLLLSLLGFLFDLWTTGVAYTYRRNVVSAAGRAEVRRLFEPQFTLQLLAITASGIVLVALGPALGRLLFGGKISVSPWLLGMWLEAQLLYRLVQDFFRFTFRFTAYNFLVGGFPAFYMASLGAVVLSGGRLSVDRLLELQIIAYTLVSALFLRWMLGELGLPKLRLPWREVLADLRLGFPLTIQLVVNFALASSDRYLIAAFLGVADVGRYQPAYQLGWALVFFPSIGYVILGPALWRMVDAGERDRAAALVASVTRMFLMLAVPFVAGAAMLGPSILAKLANPDTGVGGRWVIPLVALAVAPYTVFSFASAVAFALNRTKILLAASVAGATVNLALNVLLLPILKTLVEPAAATLAGYGVSCIVLLVALRGLWTWRFEWLPLLRFGAATAAMALLLWVFGYRPGAVAAAGIPALAGALVGAVAVYFGALWLLGGIGRRERAEIASFAALGSNAHG